MEELQIIIKELRVDWDNMISEDFNPLHNALSAMSGSTKATEFRDMFNKLELAMQKIISINYTGFSDSILCYNRIYEGNSTILNNLTDILNVCNLAMTDSWDIPDLNQIVFNAEYLQKKIQICNVLNSILQSFERLSSINDLQIKADSIINSLDLINNQELYSIPAVEDLRKLILEKYMKIVDEVNLKIDYFVFKGDIEASNYFKTILILGSLSELEKYFKNNFQRRVFEEIESIIQENTKEKNFSLENLCKKISKKIESIKENMYSIILKCNRHFEIQSDNTDFFGNDKNRFPFVTDQRVTLSLIVNELTSFIILYSKFDQVENSKFDINRIIDDIDYDKIFDSKYNLYNRLIKSEDNFVLKQSSYTVISAPDPQVILYFLKYIKHTAIKDYLITQMENLYLKHLIDSTKEKIIRMFEDDWAKLDNENSKLVIFNELDKILKNDYIKDSEILDQIKNIITENTKKAYLLKYDEIFMSEIIKDIHVKKNELNNNEKTELFKKSIINKCINKNDLLSTKKSHQIVMAMIFTLEELKKELRSKEIEEIYKLYYNSYKHQLNIEFFYYFDLFYRQGNSKYYLKKIVQGLENVFNIEKNNDFYDGLYENIVFYCKENVAYIHANTIEEAEEFVESIKLLDEIMGEIDFHNDLEELYLFFNNSIKGKSEEKLGKILYAKIR